MSFCVHLKLVVLSLAKRSSILLLISSVKVSILVILLLIFLPSTAFADRSLLGIHFNTSPSFFEVPFKSESGENQQKSIFADNHLNSRFRSLTGGYISGLALLNQTSDRLGMINPPADGMFFDVSNGTSQYNMESHLDLTSFTLLTGLSKQLELAQGPITVGAFFEYGNGGYDTFNAFGDAALTLGEGNVNHFGGGLLGRADFRNTGFYTEGSLRAGSVHNEFGSDFNGHICYDSSSPYLGMHLGLGNVRHLSKKTSLDLYGKYFWTQQNSDSARLSSGQDISFDDANSHRLQLGGRINRTVNNRIKTYWGVALGQEFSGSVRGSGGGYFFGGPTLKRGMVLGEWGIIWKPIKNSGLSLGFGLQGYLGKREGIAAGWQLRWQRMGNPIK